MFDYDTLSYFVFLTAALVIFGFATALTSRAYSARKHTVNRLKQTVGAALGWALCTFFLVAPFWGAADWLARRL